jgi:hypothetical protein
LDWWGGRGRRRWRGDILDPLPHFHDLDGPSARVRFDPAALGPGVGIVVVADICQEEARLGLVDDDPDVATDPYRPEMWIARTLDAVEAQAWAAGSICRSNAVVLAAFCSAVFRRASADVNVAAIRNSITRTTNSRPRVREPG